MSHTAAFENLTQPSGIDPMTEQLPDLEAGIIVQARAWEGRSLALDVFAFTGGIIAKEVQTSDDAHDQSATRRLWVPGAAGRIAAVRACLDGEEAHMGGVEYQRVTTGTSVISFLPHIMPGRDNAQVVVGLRAHLPDRVPATSLSWPYILRTADELAEVSLDLGLRTGLNNEDARLLSFVSQQQAECLKPAV